MSIKLGTIEVNKTYSGGTQINKMYLGDTVVFGGGGGALGSLSFIPISTLIGSITLFEIGGGGGKLGNDSTFFNWLSDIKLYKYFNNAKSDFLICIVGDGTILDASTLVGKTEIPIIGINAGRLGFLANNNFDEVIL